MFSMFLYIFCNRTIDLVPVSSTVIPLYTYNVNSTGAKYHPMSVDEEEYRIAYMKHLHKKHEEAADDPDTLITCNSKLYITLILNDQANNLVFQ